MSVFYGLAQLLCRLLITRYNVVLVLMPNKINRLPNIFFILYHQEAKYVIFERDLSDNIWIYHCKVLKAQGKQIIFSHCHQQSQEKVSTSI